MTVQEWEIKQAYKRLSTALQDAYDLTEDMQAAKAADEAREDARLTRERELEAEWEAWQAAHPEYDPTDDEPI